MPPMRTRSPSGVAPAWMSANRIPCRGITFGRIVYSQFGIAFNWPFGAALSVILMAVVLAALWLATVLGRTAGGDDGTGRR